MHELYGWLLWMSLFKLAYIQCRDTIKYPIEDNIKHHKVYSIVPAGIDIYSILDVFFIFFPITLINFIFIKTNQRAEIMSSRENLQKFMLDWLSVTNGKFLVLILFVSLVVILSQWDFLSTGLISQILFSVIIPSNLLIQIKGLISVLNTSE